MRYKPKFFCVYRITNTKLGRHYYGFKSTIDHPKTIVGVTYFSSSKDKNFILDQHQNPQNYKYKIVKLFGSRIEALAYEIKLHAKFDVGSNPSFYNLAKQTSVGFTTGKISEETRRKMSMSRSGELHYLFGKKRSNETKKRISEALSGENHPMFGKHLKDETREILKVSHTGKANPRYGKRNTKEHNEAISRAHTGKIVSSETKNRMKLANLGNKNPNFNPTLFEFYNKDMDIKFCGTRSDFCTTFGIHKANLTSVINGTRKTVSGWEIIKEKE